MGLNSSKEVLVDFINYSIFGLVNESYFQDSLFLLEECGHSNPDRCSVRSLDVAL